MFNRINPDVSKKVFVRDLNEAGYFNPYEHGFDFAFGIMRDYPNLDPSIGKFTLNCLPL